MNELWRLEFHAPTAGAATDRVRHALGHELLFVAQSGRLGWEITGSLVDLQRVVREFQLSGVEHILSRASS